MGTGRRESSSGVFLHRRTEILAEFGLECGERILAVISRGSNIRVFGRSAGATPRTLWTQAYFSGARFRRARPYQRQCRFVARTQRATAQRRRLPSSCIHSSVGIKGKVSPRFGLIGIPSLWTHAVTRIGIAVGQVIGARTSAALVILKRFELIK